MSAHAPVAPEIRQAYARYTLTDSIRNSKVACILVMILMPMGYVLDYFVYHEHLAYFFKLRLCTSALAALVFVALRQKGWSERQYRILCAGWYVVPPSTASDSAKQFASFSTRTSLPSALSRSPFRSWPIRQVELAFFTLPVTRDSAPGIPTPIVPCALSSCSACPTSAATAATVAE